MGNRAVITTKDINKSNANQKLGIYVHWCGAKEDVEKALKLAKERNIRKPFEDYSYFWARFTQAFADIITGYECGIGIDLVSNLDCYNSDNGVYYIDNDLNIVNHTDGSELT